MYFIKSQNFNSKNQYEISLVINTCIKCLECKYLIYLKGLFDNNKTFKSLLKTIYGEK